MRQGGPTGSVLPDGRFTLSGVAPGDYTLSVRAFFDESELLKIVSSGSLEDTAFTMPLSVPAAPISDLRIVIAPTIDVPGRVQLDGAPPPAGAVLVAASAAGQPESIDGARVLVGADGRFTLRVRPGQWQIAPVSTNKWMLKRMLVRGQAVDPLAPVTITGEPQERLEILLTSQLTVVTGTARDSNGALVRDFHAIVFPAQPAASQSVAKRPRIERADREGRFRFEGLLPGDYLVAALIDFDPEDGALDDELLEAIRPSATPLQVSEGGTETLTVKLARLP
jgi:hypothetical protein